MIKFKQLINPGDKGRDVVAVRRALRKMGHKIPRRGRKAGHSWVRALKSVQRAHKLKVDGVYGNSTHEVIAPHFDPYARWLYRHSRLRKPPVPNYSAAAAAQKLLTYHAKGKYRDDRGTCLPQIQATAEGKAVLGAMGYVHLDRRVLDMLIWLIEKGHTVGTFALCSDHGYDGPHGHAGGHAVDISSFNGILVASSGGRASTLDAAKLLHNAPGDLRPWQLICNGYNYRYDSEIAAETIPNYWYYGPTTMQQHENHIHYGVY